jgi:hypothetical protein
MNNYQMIRQAVREEFANKWGVPDEDEEAEYCDECPAMACIRDHRDVIRDLENRIAELERRPIITAEPIQTTAFDHLIRPWNITYSRPD